MTDVDPVRLRRRDRRRTRPSSSACCRRSGAAHRGAQRVGRQHRGPDDGRSSTGSRGTSRERGMGVSAIASPIGKVDVTLPVEHEVERLGRAHRARRTRLGTPLHPHLLVLPRRRASPRGHPRRRARADARARRPRRAGRRGARCTRTRRTSTATSRQRVLDLVESVGSTALRRGLGQRELRPGRRAPVHRRLRAAAAVPGIPAGQGRARRDRRGRAGGRGRRRAAARPLTALRDDGYAGFASLEPHLTDVNALGGFSGPAAFGRAARAFRALTARIGVDLA